MKDFQRFFYNMFPVFRFVSCSTILPILMPIHHRNDAPLEMNPSYGFSASPLLPLYAGPSAHSTMILQQMLRISSSSDFPTANQCFTLIIPMNFLSVLHFFFCHIFGEKSCNDSNESSTPFNLQGMFVINSTFHTCQYLMTLPSSTTKPH